MIRWLTAGMAVLSCFLLLTPTSARPGGTLQYNRDIRPILAENCFVCHGPDSGSRKADLRLDLRDAAIKAEAIVPGDASKSGLIERIFNDDPDQVMPPTKSHKKLTKEQKETLKQWIAAGAEYQPHWAYITPTRPTPPNNGLQPIDAFVRAELNRIGLTPAPEADRRTLARRLSLDLVGLPPEPADVEAFVYDKSSNWYEKYVDKLLASPHWGEHRGRYWLDAARYADTHGIHFDNYREIWAYRDWVIAAFNANMPFDRFTIEQLAGDLLPDATLDQRIATGFNRCNITSNEGGAIDEEYLVLYTRDRTETMAQVFLGTTAGCAVCHDHKFDPLSQREFYSLAAFFNNHTQRAMDGNVKDTPPVMPVPLSDDRPRWNELNKEVAVVRGQIDERKKSAQPDFDKWLAETTAAKLYGDVPMSLLHLHALMSEGGPTLSFQIDGQLRPITPGKAPSWKPGHLSAQSFATAAETNISLDDVGDREKDQPFTMAAWVWLPSSSANGAVVARMDEANGYRGWDLWLENGKIGTHIIHRWPDDALKAVSANRLSSKKWHHVVVSYDGSATTDGISIFVDGVRQTNKEIQANDLKSTIKTSTPFTIGRRSKSQVTPGVQIQDLRLYRRAFDDLAARELAFATRAAAIVAKPQRSDAEKQEMFGGWLALHDEPARQLFARRDELQREEQTIRGRGTVAHVFQEQPKEAMAFVLNRGEYDQRRDQVKPDTPKMLPTFPNELARNRHGLAQWLLRPENPLTARVTVNRFWQELFGNGLVRTSGDFGTTGELPSHPELLDWLAIEFRENGWDVKKFFKMLVMSQTYRQSALTTPEKRERDPQNKWLSRGPRFRMDAEMVRDQALAASGLLVRKIGGPSVKPYQPEGVWEAVAMIGSDTRDYKQDHGEKLYRRSMYTFWKRAAPPASLDILNAPNRETCAVRRERTNTPLQALVTLNDIQFVEAARNLAQLALQQELNDEDRINWIAQRVVARPMKPVELKVIQSTLTEFLHHYQAKPEEAKKLITVGESKPDPKLDAIPFAAWTMVCNQLMNLDEVVSK